MAGDGLQDNPTLVPGEHLDVSDEAKVHWQGEQGLVAFFETLAQQRLWPDAVKVLAHLMDKRHAVWWGCLCCWPSERPEPKPANAKALHVTVAWVCDPSEPNRQACGAAGGTVGMGEAAGCLATAAFVSGGSMLPPNLPVVPPPPHLTGQVVASAVLLAAAASSSTDPDSLYHELLELGRAVAAGRFPWTAPAPSHASNPAPVAARA